MPERPKRRKNRNKRKNNKNSNTDVNKNNIEESETLNESCSSITDNITKENETPVEDEKLDIRTSATSNGSFKIVKSDITQVADNDKNKNESSTSQIYAGSNNKPSVEIISELELDKDITKKFVATSEICPVLHETRKTDAEIQTKEVDNKKSTSSEVCSLSKQSLSNNKINEQTEHVLQKYIVEPPEQVETSKTKCKLDNTKKSKSCDSDDCPTIVEITDDYNVQSDDSSLSAVNNSNILITGDESDIEWEKVHHFNLPQTQLIQGILSSDTIPLNIVHCDEIKSLSPQDEQSLRDYLHTLNLSTNPLNSNDGDIKTEIEQIINREIQYRLRKKGFTEDTTFIRAGPSRSLAVIDEEGSGDSSKTSRRHSYLSDKKSDNDELEDEVFECKPTRTARCSNINLNANNSNKRLIPQPCIRVDAKLKEPEISEARGDWSMKTVEKMTGAELVYLTDSSSSTSSMYDLNDDADKGEETDVTVRMITPTIEVTDTESLLSNTFLTENSDKSISKCCENEDVLKSTDNLTKNLKDIETSSDKKYDAHEIVILSTDDIKTNLFVKDINESKSATESEEICESKLENNSKESALSSSTLKNSTDTYDLEIKVLKCELNNAINNLIKEVISDSENCKETSKDTITRQDSSSSLDSSQCTIKYNPTNSSLNDVSNILQEDSCENTNKENFHIDTGSSHVKDVLQCVTAKPPLLSNKAEIGYSKQPSKLKDICVRKITSFPFGDKIIEELAQVSLRLQNMSVLASERNQAVKNQPINKDSQGSQINTEQYELKKSSENKTMYHTNIPPPILPRKSSLKIAQDEPVKFIPPKSEAKYECLSPSQKMLMEKTNTTIEKDFKSQSNLLTSKTNIGNEKESNHPLIKTSFTPMKSETGSRLLALLRDTSIPNNLNRQSLEDRDLNHIPKLKTHSETFSKRLLDELDSTNQYRETTSTTKSTSTIISSSSYKPLPPPKPKKLTTYFYESDEGSDYRRKSFRTMHNNKKYFHHSTGNLNKEIEDDISSIQNMHRYCTNLRNQSYESSPRRPSLPKDLCDQQMEYIRQKEKEVDEELRRLEQEQNKYRNRGPRAPMISEDKNHYGQTVNSKSKSFVNKDFTSTSQTHKNTGNSKLSSLFSSSQEELLREKMYSEYMNQMAEREQRKQQRVIKVTQTPVNTSILSKSMPLLGNLDSKMNNRIEEEFISKAKERWYKLGIKDPETKDKMAVDSDLYREPKVIEHKIKVIEAGEEKDVQNLPSHMQEFVKFTVKDKEQDTGSTGESNADKASAHVVVFCAVIILVLSVGKFLLQLLRKK